MSWSPAAWSQSVRRIVTSWRALACKDSFSACLLHKLMNLEIGWHRCQYSLMVWTLNRFQICCMPQMCITCWGKSTTQSINTPAASMHYTYEKPELFLSWSGSMQHLRGTSRSKCTWSQVLISGIFMLLGSFQMHRMWSLESWPWLLRQCAGIQLIKSEESSKSSYYQPVS